MARGVNKVILIGNLGAEPEIRYMPSGSAFASVRIATSESWTDKQTNQKQERTEWHRVSFFNRLAEVVGQYLRKGSKVYVEGSLRTRKWQDKNGMERYTTEIIANEMQMLDSKGGPAVSFSTEPASTSENTSPVPTLEEAAVSSSSNPSRDFDDEIPF